MVNERVSIETYQKCIHQNELWQKSNLKLKNETNLLRSEIQDLSIDYDKRVEKYKNEIMLIKSKNKALSFKYDKLVEKYKTVAQFVRIGNL